MSFRHTHHRAKLSTLALSLVYGSVVVLSLLPQNVSAQIVRQVSGRLGTARVLASCTALGDGRVLVAGGLGDDSLGTLNSTELFDPSSDQFVPGPNLAGARRFHTATVLPDGRVLIAGGTEFAPLNTVEIYDPHNNSISPAAPLNVGRAIHTAILLPSGKVFVAGGGGTTPQFAATATIEIYDPAMNLWTLGTPMAVAREIHTAVLLGSGKVLVSGGRSTTPGTALSSQEVYDPATDTWAPVAPIAARLGHTALQLTDGRVLLSGGRAQPESQDIYDPITDMTDIASGPEVARLRVTSASLQGGLALLIAGRGFPTSPSARVDVFSPSLGAVAFSLQLSTPRDAQCVAALTGNRVLVVAGTAVGKSPPWLDTAEIIDGTLVEDISFADGFE